MVRIEREFRPLKRTLRKFRIGRDRGEMHREGRNVLGHAAVYLLARGLPGIVAFLAIPLFSRLLEPADYGRYALVLASVGLLNALLFQWLRLSLVRYLPAFKDDPARLKSTLVSATLLLVVALGALAAVD